MAIETERLSKVCVTELAPALGLVCLAETKLWCTMTGGGLQFQKPLSFVTPAPPKNSGKTKGSYKERVRGVLTRGVLIKCPSNGFEVTIREVEMESSAPGCATHVSAGRTPVFYIFCKEN